MILYAKRGPTKHIKTKSKKAKIMGKKGSQFLCNILYKGKYKELLWEIQMVCKEYSQNHKSRRAQSMFWFYARNP